jgi:hypothetical protein
MFLSFVNGFCSEYTVASCHKDGGKPGAAGSFYAFLESAV